MRISRWSRYTWMTTSNEPAVTRVMAVTRRMRRTTPALSNCDARSKKPFAEQYFRREKNCAGLRLGWRNSHRGAQGDRVPLSRRGALARDLRRPRRVAVLGARYLARSQAHED